MPNKMAGKIKSCPVCKKARAEEFKPFCSKGCRDRDLLRWFGEDYRVPVAQAPDGGLDGDRLEDQ